MRYAVNLPNLGHLADPHLAVELAVRAEEAGWDGVFVWDHILGWDGSVVADPWVLLSAMAQATSRIRLGPMVTPLPRRRPWVVARQATSLDHLSEGRLVLGAGLGTPRETEYETFGEEGDPRVRGDRLDEGLEIVTGMWTGEEFRFDGRHFRVQPATFLPVPVQNPRIPIWVAGRVGARRPFRRASRFDGVFPITAESGTPEPDEVAEVLAYVRQHRSGDDPFDVTVAGPPPSDPTAYADAGVTWYQVAPRPDGEAPDETRAWISAGPPGS